MSPESSEMYVEKGWDVVIIKPNALFILCTCAFNQISQSDLSRGIANPFCNIVSQDVGGFVVLNYSYWLEMAPHPLTPLFQTKQPLPDFTYDIISSPSCERNLYSTSPKMSFRHIHAKEWLDHHQSYHHHPLPSFASMLDGPSGRRCLSGVIAAKEGNGRRLLMG